MRMSISTMSGRSRRARSTACSPSPASPTTSMSAWASSNARNPARTSAWSSARSTRINRALFSWGVRLVGRTTVPGRASGRIADREAGADPEALGVRTGTGRDLPAQRRHAFAHARDAVAAVRQVARGAPPVAADIDEQVAVRVLQQYVGRHAGPGVTGDVRERLLDDPERGQVDARGQRTRLAGRPQAHGDAGHAGAGEQVVQASQPGGGRSRRALVDLAQHAEHGPYLGERL